MPFTVPTGTSRRGATRMLWLLAVAAILVPIVILTMAGVMSWRDKQREAWETTGRLIDLIHANVSRLFDIQFMVLNQVGVLATELRPDSPDDAVPAVQARMQALLAHLPHVREMCVVGADGRVIVGTSDMAVRGNDIAARDFVRYFMKGGVGVFISRPLEIRSSQRAFVIAIRRADADGDFNGVVAATVDPEFLENYFQRTIAAYSDFSGRTIGLRRSDGTLLARYSAADHPPPARTAEPTLRVIQDPADGGRLTVDAGERNDQSRLVAWRRMPDTGLVLITSITHAAIVQDWLDTMLPHLYLLVPSTIALLFITWLAVGRTRQAVVASRQFEEERQRRYQAEEAARQSQKMEALGKLTGGVAHDFNNLLAVILGSAELARNRPPDRVNQHLDSIIHAGQRAARLTRQLLSFSRTQAVAPRVVDLHADLARMMEIMKPSLRGNIDLVVAVDDDVWPVEIDPDEWEIALLNVAVNARDAMPEGGRFSVSVSNVVLAKGDVRGAPELAGRFVKVAMADTGVGMTPDVVTRAFEPFFTTKEIGRGTGLGLSQVYGFARQSGGSAVVDSRPGHGTTLTLYLPRSSKSPEAAETLGGSVHVKADGRRQRVLMVEDSDDVAAITTDMLTSLGYEVHRVSNARRALDRLAAPGQPYHLLLADVVLPGGMSGTTLAREMRVRQPELAIILTSGYAETGAELRDGFALLRKPFSLEELAWAVRAELGPETTEETGAAAAK